VWLTTLLGLDWPVSSLRGDVVAQQKALRDMFDDLERRNFNVVFFQVRSRGNAMYRSSMEPWGSELTGSLGKDPGWDPLDFAIREARQRGLELHAWFNVFRVWSKGYPPVSSPRHIALAQPSWVQRFGDDLWLDPGIPEAREYTIRVMEDIVRRYDVDGIHFDYCRYPDRGFNDEATWRQYGSGSARDDWRRNNVNHLVEHAYRRLTAIRPGLIVGSAPIGIYRNLPTARGWEGRNAIYQDSRAWLEGGYHDYVAPQIYWGLTRNGSRIDFEALVRDWSRHDAGRHVYPGVAAYKNEIAPYLHEHIDATRIEGADGVVFFRYEHIRGESFRGRFDQKTLAPPLTWRDYIRPNPPRALRVSRNDDVTIASWDTPIPATDGDTASWYAVYAARDEHSINMLHAVLPATVRTCTLRGVASVLVTAVDKARNESAAASVEAPASEPVVLPAPSIPVSVARVSSLVPFAGTLALLGFELPHTMFVRLRLMDENGAEVQVLLDEFIDAGLHVIGIELERLRKNVVSYIFEIGDERFNLPFEIDNE